MLTTSGVSYGMVEAILSGDAGGYRIVGASEAGVEGVLSSKGVDLPDCPLTGGRDPASGVIIRVRISRSGVATPGSFLSL